MANNTLISIVQNRVYFLSKLYKSQSIILSLALIVAFSLVFFQENQIFGSAVIVFFIHYSRKDILLLKIAYGEKYKVVLFLEYLLIFSLYVATGVFINDPFLLYSPLLFVFIMAIIYFIRPGYNQSNSKPALMVSLVSNKDFIWRSGIRATQIKFFILYLFFVPLMIAVRNIYLFSILLFSIFLVVNTFYKHKISDIYLDIINSNPKKSLLILYKKNLLSVFTFITIPAIIQFCLFSSSISILYSVASLITCIALLFQFLCTNIEACRNNKPIALVQLVNGFSVIAILLPPLLLPVIVYSVISFNKLN